MRVGSLTPTVADAVETDDSEDADSDSGDPARRTFRRFLGRPFSFGAVVEMMRAEVVIV